VFLGPEKEWLIQYCKEILEKKHFDFFIFGHRHIPIDYDFPNGSKYINLGDWINHFTYAELDGENLNLKKYNRTN
jgi:UDP-2,3-diacylglucosamine hydrolase